MSDFGLGEPESGSDVDSSDDGSNISSFSVNSSGSERRGLSEFLAGSDSGDSSDYPDGPLPYESEHPNKYVPWSMKMYPPDIIEAWTMVHNSALTGNGIWLPEFLGKLQKEVLDQPNHDRETLLYMAAFRGHADIVEELLKAGASPNKGDEFVGMTPLATAVKNCHTECVKKLLEYTDVNEKNSDGFTAIFSAADFGPDQHEVEILNCPHYKANLQINKPKNRVILELLIKKGADVNYVSDVGLTPLLVAASSNNAYATRRLLECGADPMALYKDYISLHTAPITALDKAAEQGCTKSLKVIVEFCAGNKALMSRSSAMHLAVRAGHLSCVKYLVNSGFDADLGVKLSRSELDQFSKSDDAVPVLTSLDKNYGRIGKYLLSHGALPLYRGLPIAEPLDRCPIYVAFRNSDDCVLQELLGRCAFLERAGQAVGNGSRVEFPVTEPIIWEQSPTCFEMILRAGFEMDLESAPFEAIVGKGNILEIVTKIWWQLTDQIPRHPHLVSILGSNVEKPRTLTDLCRVAVRRRIGFPRLAEGYIAARNLPIPPHLQDFISYCGHYRVSEHPMVRAAYNR